MKKGQTGAGTIEKNEFPNKGILYTEDGERVVVKNGLPGQRVSFQVTKKRKGKCEGRILEVLEKSPMELEEPFCRHFGICGGCTYQNLEYERQLQLKSDQVRELLEEALRKEEDGAFPGWFEGIKPSPKQFAYRNKMEFSFGDEYKDGPLALGMHKRGSFYDLVTVKECRIVDEDFREILKAVLDYFSSLGVCYLKKNTHIGYLRHLLVRKAEKTGEILIDLVTTTQTELLPSKAGLCEGRQREEKLMEGFRDCLLGLPLNGKIVGILHTRNDSLADAIIDEGTETLYGQDFFYEELLGLRFRITPFSFFQTNSSSAEVLYQTVREYIETVDRQHTKVVYDLYSGTGTIAQLIAPVAGKVIGVELVKEAVEAARENATDNGLANCEFIAGDVLKVLDTIAEKPDFIILDPPRDGVHPKALERIVGYGVEQLIYVSCKPTSLARDLEVFLRCGYRLERVCCVDQFPGTGHVECVIKIQRRDM